MYQSPVPEDKYFGYSSTDTFPFGKFADQHYHVPEKPSHQTSDSSTSSPPTAEPSPYFSDRECLEQPESEMEKSPSNFNSKRRVSLSKAERRAEHNAIERARRECLNSKFQQLADVLPNLQNHRRPSKGQIVEKALDWVKQNLTKEERYQYQIMQLQNENRRLMAHIAMNQNKPSMITPTASVSTPITSFARNNCFDTPVKQSISGSSSAQQLYTRKASKLYHTSTEQMDMTSYSTASMDNWTQTSFSNTDERALDYIFSLQFTAPQKDECGDSKRPSDQCQGGINDSELTVDGVYHNSELYPSPWIKNQQEASYPYHLNSSSNAVYYHPPYSS
ncbi:hypothetical protein CU097_009169 [Rhizopus azygosporus]|uniref:BHLH domain-containing protein n=1 Tax=Rhizopus azygosporus TaxID=86630 RepID=A0A367K3I4_RHIAZ|nr:hypothetical protein CU097_009169 [Rhizopus azygosporus]